MPNTLAYFALIAWPLISGLLYFRLNALTATFSTIVGGYLFLPVKVAIDFPYIPSLDKQSIPALAALFGCAFIKKTKLDLIPKSGIERVLVGILLILPIFSVLTNAESIQDGMRAKRGLELYDAASTIFSVYIILIPYILGRSLIKNREDLLDVLKMLVLAGLIYSPFILFEVRMSPQLHSWIYGFFPHSFSQQVRFGGFRPVVFLGHGLLVATFVAISLMAAVALWRQRIKILGLPSFAIVLYFVFILLACRTFGAWILGFGSLIILIVLSARGIAVSALCLSSLAISYPLLSMLHLFPHEQLVELVSNFSVDRAQSLDFRFYHEALLLDHAMNKYLFGWGGEGRNRLANSVTDGYWIIQFGESGALGFLSKFGLLFSAIYLALRFMSRYIIYSRDTILASFMLIISIIMIDQIPNDSLHMHAWFLVGACIGFVRNVFPSESHIVSRFLVSKNREA